MRYDTRIELVHAEPAAYDPETGNYAESPETVKSVWANVTDTGLQALTLIGTQIRQDSKTVRLQQKPEFVFERVRIAGKMYQVDTVRHYRTKETLFVSRVNA